MATLFFFFFFFFLLSFPLYSLQTAFVAPIYKDHISLLYTISVHLKTPLRPASLHLDLGGAFSWIDCYNHYNSSSYQFVLCNSPLSISFHQNICGSCVQAPSPICANDTIFSFAYPEKPSLRDQFVDYSHPKLTDSENLITDVLALSTTDGSNSGPLRRIPEIPFSCVKTDFLRGLARDVIGFAALGRSNESIPSQISAKFNSPKFFAICLSGTRLRPGVAFFGSKGPYRFSPNVDLSKSLTYTPLLFNPVSASIYTYWLPSYEYYIGLSAIRINGKAVAFNTSLLSFEPNHGGGGTKISTSTSYALLQSSIYRAFATAFMKESALLNFTLTNAVKPFGVCYAAESVGVTAEGQAKAPVVDLMMEEGKVVWKLGGRNTMVRIKKNGVDAWCLGFINGGEFPRTPIVIGGLQLEDHLLQFDLENYRFGFSSSALTEGTSCSNFNFTSINKFALSLNTQFSDHSDSGILFREKILYLENHLNVDFRKAFRENPHSRSATLSTLKSVEVCLSSMGLELSAVGRVLDMYPKLLTSNPDYDLYPIFDFLLNEVQIPFPDIRKSIIRCPRILVSDLDLQLRPALKFLRDLGFVGLNAITCQTTMLLVSSVEHTLLPKIQYLESLGLSHEDVVNMVLRSPGLLTYSIQNNLVPKVSYFLGDMEGDLLELKSFPQYFSFSLERKIMPRHRSLVEHGLSLPLSKMLKVSDGEFTARLIEMRLQSLTVDR